ncbi:MAG TPA: sigma-70 family RNA polymerase sigma factor [Rhodobacteraceae bacterium]|nr:sigma-70 family RNA polymerase sigma factor [Paracoccaceae bacterium]
MTKAAPDAVHTAIDYTLRQDRGRLIAALTAAIGDFGLAEECLQDAIEVALEKWPASGIPKSRRGWLLQVARRRALDRFRRAKNLKQKSAQIAVLEQAEADAPEDTHDIPDYRLRLIFTCCHPALDEKTRVALTLRTLGGLTTEEIARAYLDKPATMGQRLARARNKISKAGIPFEIPDGEALEERINSVLSVIYLIFNEGYAASSGDAPIRIDLCEEAIFLARLMVQLCPDVPEVAGLLALILMTHSRNKARYHDGAYVPLDEQDRTLWDGKRIAEGQRILEAAMKRGQVGPYQLQAAIAALHCEAASAAETDWPQIAALYRLLAQITPSDIVLLNLAVAVSYSEGVEPALGLLKPMDGKLQNYQPYHAARADILRRAGCAAAAQKAYEQALALTENEADRIFLKNRQSSLTGLPKKRPS